MSSSVCEDSKLIGRRSSRLTKINEQIEREKSIRRSVRDPGLALLDRSDVKILLKRIRNNNGSTVVLKIKDQILADINSVVFDAILEALWKNTVCQGLYIQNLSKSIGDNQLRKLVELLKKKKIWCLNIGETYEVSQRAWRYFCDSLHTTNITHLYVSEHIISNELKNDMRFYIRENRKKHNLHCAFKNLRVIERCTHCWWNPINGVKELKPPPPTPPPSDSDSDNDEEDDDSEQAADEEEKAAGKIQVPLTPFHPAYWQEGVGEGGQKPWKFKCVCGEMCSSYESHRYHPTGQMFECSNPACRMWSHVKCVLGDGISDEQLSEMTDALCGACKSKSRRMSKYLGVRSIHDLYVDEREAAAATLATITTTVEADPIDPSAAANKRVKTAEEEEREDMDRGPWKFKCKCGQECSYYEKKMYHPTGQWYECSKCSVWSHVVCMLGAHVTPEDVKQMAEVLCFSCFTKDRRSRARGDKDKNCVAASNEKLHEQEKEQEKEQEEEKKVVVEGESAAQHQLEGDISFPISAIGCEKAHKQDFARDVARGFVNKTVNAQIDITTGQEAHGGEGSSTSTCATTQKLAPTVLDIPSTSDVPSASLPVLDGGEAEASHVVVPVPKDALPHISRGHPAMVNSTHFPQHGPDYAIRSSSSSSSDDGVNDMFTGVCTDYVSKDLATEIVVGSTSSATAESNGCTFATVNSLGVIRPAADDHRMLPATSVHPTLDSNASYDTVGSRNTADFLSVIGTVPDIGSDTTEAITTSASASHAPSPAVNKFSTSKCTESLPETSRVATMIMEAPVSAATAPEGDIRVDTQSMKESRDTNNSEVIDSTTTTAPVISPPIEFVTLPTVAQLDNEDVSVLVSEHLRGCEDFNYWT